jgi:hypothetical protein
MTCLGARSVCIGGGGACRLRIPGLHAESMHRYLGLMYTPAWAAYLRLSIRGCEGIGVLSWLRLLWRVIDAGGMPSAQAGRLGIFVDISAAVEISEDLRSNFEAESSLRSNFYFKTFYDLFVGSELQVTVTEPIK